MIVTRVDPSLDRIRAKLLSESETRPREVLITLHRCTIQSGAFTHERTGTIDEAEGIVYADLDLSQVETRRANMPLNHQRRRDLYAVMDVTRLG